ncbi:NUCLEAR FRAGILE X MENTAL RETARDATION PROTEIN INTERACTING PROTEIN 1 [Ceraceosorus bombacis]|uniref:NUCLEAR FRAGILE X MENTAL RETARDATION PROTEIN INTERACTING PROTEIN 1 n=1 Tax=Ceraceosorus bombacis TaxID=401625 RepID=A0A0P1BL28_9BASI|nr:NUCLEAR FRAGILE X MENTAL RETARDATION PROTEIN INTERACTING PROTEIN 1 [Ceraceosorus bombacis]
MNRPWGRSSQASGYGPPSAGPSSYSNAYNHQSYNNSPYHHEHVHRGGRGGQGHGHGRTIGRSRGMGVAGPGARGRGRGASRGGSKRAAPMETDVLGLEGHLECGHVEQPARQPSISSLPVDASPSTSQQTTPEAGGEATSVRKCPYRTRDPTSLALHKYDRHLILPAGGRAELDRIDPIRRWELAEERKQAVRAAKRQAPEGPSQEEDSDSGSDDESDAGSSSSHGSFESPRASASSALKVSGQAVDPTQTISGLNITLSTPQLIEQWRNERRKRFPTQVNVDKKLREAWNDEKSRERNVGRDAEERSSKKQRVWGSREKADGKSEATQDAESRQPETVAGRREDERTSAAHNTVSQQEEGGNSDSDSDGPPEEISTKQKTLEGAVEEKQRSSSTSRQENVDASDSSDSESSSGSHSSEGSTSETRRVQGEPLADEPSLTEDPSKRHGEAATQNDSGATSASGANARSEQTLAGPNARVCQHWLRGKCSYGSQCRSKHLLDFQSSRSAKQHRPRPKAPPSNPFAQPNLLRALLEKEIAQHVSYVAQFVRFLVRNDVLEGVERQVGDAALQRERRRLIEEVVASDAIDKPSQQASSSSLVAGTIAQIDGSVATLPAQDGKGRALYRPPSPLLQPLSELNYPPEPDPFIFLDPLRANDPMPLTHAQLVSLSVHPDIRDLLHSPTSAPSRTAQALGQHLPTPPALQRALKTLDALPSLRHRQSALEIMLGVSEQSPQHAHQLAPTFVRRTPNQEKDRVISESELFRLGLRVGTEEVKIIQKLAGVVATVVGNIDFQPDSGNLAALADGETLRTESMTAEQERQAFEQRQAERMLGWQREAEKRDMLRSLGIDVD